MRWTLAVMLAAGVGAPVVYAQPSQQEEVIVARTGEIVRVTWGPRRDPKTGQREVVAVTDLSRRPLSGYVDSAARRPLTWGVLSTEAMPTRVQASKRAQVSGDGLLVRNDTVYVRGRGSRPRLLFAVPRGETVVAVSRGALAGGTVPRSGKWTDFVAISTNAGIYVVDAEGDVQVKSHHMGGEDGGSVRVYRAQSAKAAVTYIWYGRGPWSPDAKSSRVVEFRGGRLSREIGFE